MSDQEGRYQGSFEALDVLLAGVVLAGTWAALNMNLASQRALKTHKEATKDDLLPIIKKLPPESFDLGQLERLRLAGEAADYVYHRLIDARSISDDSLTKLPKALVEDSTVLRDVMFKVGRFYLDHLKGAKELLDDVEKGRGYKDLSSDLERLAYLYETHADLLAADRTIYKPEDAKRAFNLHAQIDTALGEQRASNIRHWTAQQARLLHILRETYNDVAATGRWLLRKDEAAAEKRFPSLYADRAAKKKTDKTAADPAATPAPTAPADDISTGI
jgi:hypothetical protein